MAKLSEEVKKIISEVRPAMVATASKKGKPNVSPRGSFQILDDEHVMFAEGGRLYTLSNLRENPQLSAIVYNAATRQGCRIWGKAEILESGELLDKIAQQFKSMGIGMAVTHVVKVAVEEAITF